jgi:hypothetical protein
MGDENPTTRPAVIHPRLRLPTLELYSALNGAALAAPGLPLTQDERTEAQGIFGQSINLDLVRIVRTNIIAAPTTLGNNIRVPPDYSLSRRTLIHELTHVWQYQTKGTAYISDSLLHQAVASVTSGDRNAAYTYTVEPGKSIHAYTAEQQAMIVEDYYSQTALRTNAEYVRMIRQVQSARPISTSLILEEAAYGPAMGTERQRAFFDPNPTRSEGGGNVPLFRIEF